VTPEQHQKVRRFARDLGVQQSQEALLIQANQGYEILNACGLYDAADLLIAANARVLDNHRVDL
jgi:tRNA A22 N-methylase